MSKRAKRVHQRSGGKSGRRGACPAEASGGREDSPRGHGKRWVARIRPRSEAQQEYMASIEMADVCFGIGPAGTGKTYIAVALAVDMLQSGRVGRLVLTRPAVEAEGEHFGFLPGSLESKIAPYLLPVYDVLNERIGAACVKRMVADGRIELSPLAFMRGRTFTNAAVILDEMQNATMGQIRMALTRLGEGTKAIVTGDPGQSDRPAGESGLLQAAEALSGTPGIEVVRFGGHDVVRSPVVRAVIERLGT